MEALITGTLNRDGNCLYLGLGESRALVLWADADVRVARLDESDWLVNNYTTGQRFREGDMIRGGGGHYPENADLSQLTRDTVPEGCDGPAVQLYDAKKFDPALPAGVPAPPPPPPPLAPWRSPLLDEAFTYEENGFDGPRRFIPAVADASEAMFIYILQDYRADNSHKCLRDANDTLRARLSERFGTLYSGEACADRDGRIVLLANGEQAVSIHAQTDCSRIGRLGYCAGAAGGIWANLGAQSQAYRLRRKGDGWEIQKLGIGVIS